MIDVKQGRGSIGPVAALAESRRQTERFAASPDQAWLGWWEGRIYRKSPAILDNISEGGAKIVSTFAPPRRSTAWICIDGPRRTEWVEGVVMDVARRGDGKFESRIKFREVCPYAFFEVAIYGNGCEQAAFASR